MAVVQDITIRAPFIGVLSFSTPKQLEIGTMLCRWITGGILNANDYARILELVEATEAREVSGNILYLLDSRETDSYTL